MEKLAQVLHELINAVDRLLPQNKSGELHGLVDEAAAALPEPEKAAVEIAADAPGAVETAVKTADALVQAAKEKQAADGAATA